MANERDIQHITLKIGGRQFPMDVPRDDEYTYREAEKLINQRFSFYADRYPAQGNDTYLLMTLLDIAVGYKRIEASQDNAELASAMQRLVEDMEKHLN